MKKIIVYLLTQIRSVLAILVLVPFTGMCSLMALTAGLLNAQKLVTAVIRCWAQLIFFMLGLKAEYKGEENIPATGGGIIVFNHQSLLDIPALYLTTEKKLRFGAKIELFKIPLFGRAMRAIGTLPIARQNRKSVLKIYREAEAQFKENTVFVLAPEGTRQSGALIGRFKKGPFLFAVNGQVPVIPAVISGAYEVLPKGSLGVNLGKLSRTIHIEFLKPVSTVGLTTDGIEALLARVHRDMSERFAMLNTQAHKTTLADQAPADTLVIGDEADGVAKASFEL